MARRKAEKPPDLGELLAPVTGLPVRSLPFGPSWREAARARFLFLKERGLRQTDLAAWIGCAQGTISNVVGEVKPTLWRNEYLERLAAALQIPLPIRALIDIKAEEIGDDDVGLRKLFDLIDHTRSRM